MPIADTPGRLREINLHRRLCLRDHEPEPKNPEYRRELGGLVIVLQKVEDVNRLVKLAKEIFGDCEDIVALQG